MIDSAMLSMPGGRANNEDFIAEASYGTSKCFVLCDGLGGHDCGEVASSHVAGVVTSMFAATGDYPTFITDAFMRAQESLLQLQVERHMENAMKTTMVILVVTDEVIKWGHIGDSRLYHIFNDDTRYERTKDHSMVQILCDMGEITEKEMRHHEDRNKILRVMGAEWGTKSFELSGIIERDYNTHSFILMTDGFWEYVEEDEMMLIKRETHSCQEWLKEMEMLVLERADMTSTDNYSGICVTITED